MLWLFSTTQRYDEIKNHLLPKELLIDILLKRENKLLLVVLNLLWNIKEMLTACYKQRDTTWSLVNNTYSLSLEITCE